MNILFLGDGVWGHKALKGIISDNAFNVKAVIIRFTNPDQKLKVMAEQNNIPVFIEQNINNEKFVDMIREMNIDLGVSMSFDQIIKEDFRESCKNGVINCHAGKLPNYRGRNILNWALINDEKEFGVTAHYIDSGIDTGDIIAQVVVPISEEDNYNTLLSKALEKCPEVLMDAIYKIKDNRVTPIKQNYINGSYFSRRRNGDEFIDWNWSSRRIHNFIRALVEPSPGAQTYYKNKKIYIWSSEQVQYPKYISTPGEVIKKDDKGIIVKTGDTALKINLISTDENIEKVIPNIRVGERLGLNLYEKIFELENKIKELENLR